MSAITYNWVIGVLKQNKGQRRADDVKLLENWFRRKSKILDNIRTGFILYLFVLFSVY